MKNWKQGFHDLRDEIEENTFEEFWINSSKNVTMMRFLANVSLTTSKHDIFTYLFLTLQNEIYAYAKSTSKEAVGFQFDKVHANDSMFYANLIRHRMPLEFVKERLQ